MFELKKFSEGIYILPKSEGMLVDGLIIANEEMLKDESMKEALEQVKNVAHLQGIVGYSIAMPDIHWGYGFPIGGVAAMDLETGVISPGGVGYDINCGVRLALAPIPFESITKNQKEALLADIFKKLPSGVGKGHKNSIGLNETDYRKIAEKGVRFSIEEGFGFEEDIEHIESKGFLKGADLSLVSSFAKERGSHQLGSIGSGNHFVEIGRVETIFREDIALEWNVFPGQTYILIHSGSRGFGHQICQDTLDLFVQKGLGKGLVDKQLIAAPIKSELGKNYFKAMAAAANFAFNNRQQILHYIRKSFKDILNIQPEEIKLLYDVCHNIAKFETHEFQGRKKELLIHRKGATRAFGLGHEELSECFKKTGQPVLVPGDMVRNSYLMVGQGLQATWCSACHGAGRAKSRIKSMKHWQDKNPIDYINKQGVDVKATTFRTIAEEMPDAYKDVDEVVKAVEVAGLAKRVARLKPSLVIKG